MKLYLSGLALIRRFIWHFVCIKFILVFITLNVNVLFSAISSDLCFSNKLHYCIVTVTVTDEVLIYNITSELNYIEISQYTCGNLTIYHPQTIRQI